MRRPTHPLTIAASALAALALLVGAAQAEGPKNKPNGDGPDDLAPLGKAGENNAGGPVGQQNTPPIGGATQGGGGNPKEMGTVDTERAQKGSSSGDKVQPDNK